MKGQPLRSHAAVLSRAGPCRQPKLERRGTPSCMHHGLQGEDEEIM